MFLNGHIRNFVLTLPNVVKIDVKNDNLLRRCLTLFNLTLKNQNLVSMLFNVVNFNIDVHNVVSTLICRCATSQRHISLNTKLNRRWNVCYDVMKNLFEFFVNHCFETYFLYKIDMFYISCIISLLFIIVLVLESSSLFVRVLIINFWFSCFFLKCTFQAHYGVYRTRNFLQSYRHLLWKMLMQVQLILHFAV